MVMYWMVVIWIIVCESESLDINKFQPKFL